MIPERVSESTESTAERRLFARLEGIDKPGWLAFHSLSIARHRSQMAGEIDFLLLGPDGLYAVEVKGGRVRFENGLWTFTNREGRESSKRRGPFEQAREGIFSLIDDLKELAPEVRVAGRHNFGFGVVMPDVEFDIRSVEWDPAMVLDAAEWRVNGAVGAWLDGLVAFWRERQGPKEPLDGPTIRRIAKALRPQFELVPSLHDLAAGVVADQLAMTDEQYGVFDLLAANDRILCSGGAGTGKTVVAAEIARREAADGRRVLVTCRNPNLATYLRASLQDAGVAVVEEAALDPRLHGCEVLVVDEGQDVLNDRSLGVLDDLLDGGLHDGRWRFFYDMNNQSGIDGHLSEDAFDLLRSTRPAEVELTANVRNTRQVIGEVRAFTAADVGSGSGDGPPVRRVWVASNDEAISELELRLAELRRDDVPPSDITVLTTQDDPSWVLEGISSDWRNRLVGLDHTNLHAPPAGAVGVVSVRDFKGLENRFICVLGIDSLDSAAIPRIYVALSRARAGLWLAANESLQERLVEMIAGNTQGELNGA